MSRTAAPARVQSSTDDDDDGAFHAGEGGERLQHACFLKDESAALPYIAASGRVRHFPSKTAFGGLSGRLLQG